MDIEEINVNYSHLCDMCKMNSHYQIKNDEIC